MRKVLFIGVLILSLCVIGNAEAKCKNGDICDSKIVQAINDCVDHPSEDKEGMPYGIGFDLELLTSDIEDISYTVTAEYKYDINNSKQEVYAVVKLKLADIIKKVKGE